MHISLHLQHYTHNVHAVRPKLFIYFIHLIINVIPYKVKVQLRKTAATAQLSQRQQPFLPTDLRVSQLNTNGEQVSAGGSPLPSWGLATVNAESDRSESNAQLRCKKLTKGFLDPITCYKLDQFDGCCERDNRVRKNGKRKHTITVSVP